MSRPLFGVVLRLGARGGTMDRAWQILRRIAGPLRIFGAPGHNLIEPIRSGDYDKEEHCVDFARRQSRRCGMVLNLDELTALTRFPTAAVRSAIFARKTGNTRQAPAPPAAAGEVILGTNNHAGESRAVPICGEQRLQHMHVIGGSGTGKSTLLLSLMRQDLDAGRGFALLDPHGDLADAVLARVPENRLEDVVIIDPSDEGFVTPFNVLSAHSDYEKTLLASDLVSVFRRLSTSWGDRMNIIFQNLVLAFLEHGEGGTLADMRRFLVDTAWRADFLTGVDDPDVQFYWRETFPKLDGAKSVGPILTRLETLLTPKIIRYMVSQRANKLDFSRIMDEGRVFIVRLPMGQIGKENAFMLGSLVMVKLQQAAMARARMPARDRRPFFTYVDECQHFVTPGMAEILAGARKYGLGLVLAHQDLHQLSQNADVAAAVMTNAATRIVFRVSETDGRALQGDFAHYEAKDFSTLGRGEAICRIGQADQDFNLRVVRTRDVDETEATERREAAFDNSRTHYAIPRSEAEAAIRGKPSKNAAEPVTASQSRSAIAETRPQSKLSTPDLEIDASAVQDSQFTRSGTSQGKGGPEHKAFQGIIRRTGERLGFRAVLEHPVGGGNQSVDVVLTRDDLRIACEISVSTPAEHEFVNLSKCLPEGFTLIALISEDAGHRERLRSMVDASLASSDAARVFSGSCEEFIGYLEALPAASAGDARRVRGFKVKRKFVELTAEERQRISEQAFNLLAEEMKLAPPVS